MKRWLCLLPVPGMVPGLVGTAFGSEEPGSAEKPAAEENTAAVCPQGSSAYMV